MSVNLPWFSAIETFKLLSLTCKPWYNCSLLFLFLDIYPLSNYDKIPLSLGVLPHHILYILVLLFPLP